MDSEMENKESIEGTTTKTTTTMTMTMTSMEWEEAANAEWALAVGFTSAALWYRDGYWTHVDSGTEVDKLSVDMHSQESFCDGSHNRYSERSTSSDIAKFGFTAQWTGRLGSLVISGGWIRRRCSAMSMGGDALSRKMMMTKVCH
jgi:hypothetical protein